MIILEGAVEGMSTSGTVAGPHNVPSASSTLVDCLTPIGGVAKSNYIIKGNTYQFIHIYPFLNLFPQ